MEKKTDNYMLALVIAAAFAVAGFIVLGLVSPTPPLDKIKCTCSCGDDESVLTIEACDPKECIESELGEGFEYERREDEFPGELGTNAS